MNQEWFERRYAPDWERFERALEALRAGRGEPGDFPHLYRLLCQQLALARHRRLSPQLVDRLQALVLRGHDELYRTPRPLLAPIRRFFGRDFPRGVRAEGRLVALAAVLLLGPTVALHAAIQARPELVYSVLSSAQVSEFEQMYDPAAERVGRPPGAETGALAFGHYIRNNVGIAFQIFAGGALLGIGSALFLLLNGVLFGAVSGHLTHVGSAATLYAFVIGHGAFEITAIALAGAAGLRLGTGWLWPGERTRVHALRGAAARALPLVYGAASLLAVAAFVEAFWSPRPSIPASVKLAVGAGLWALVLAYLGLAGRRGAG